MATIKCYTKKNGTKAWQFQTYVGTDETGRKRFTTRRGFSSKRQCQTALNRLMLDIEENGFQKSEITMFKELYESWLPIYKTKIKASTYANTLEIFKRYIIPRFGKMELKNISVRYCQKILNEWYEHYRNYKGFRMKLNLLLDYAVSLELLATNPMRKTQVPRKKEIDKPVNFYTKDELRHFLDLYKSDGETLKYVFFHLLAYTGMRKSECFALQYQDINFLKSELSIDKTVAMDEHSKVIVQTAKTKDSKRVISLDPVTLGLIKEWQKYQREYMLKLGHNTNSSQQIIFANPRNNYYRPNVTGQWLNSFFRLHPEMKRITPHGFRFTHCSLLFEAGASMKEVQGRLGHKDVQTTMNIYAKVTPQMAENTGEKFAKFMSM